MNIFTFITAPVPPVSDQQMNLWDMIVKGGWLMIPIFILSIIAVYIICERFTVIRKASVSPKVFTEKVFSYLQNGNKTAALQECDTEDSPVSRMIKKGIHYSHIPTTELRITMENTANKEIAALEKGPACLGNDSRDGSHDRFFRYGCRYGTGILRYVSCRKQHKHHPAFPGYLYGHDYHGRRFDCRDHCLFSLQCPGKPDRPDCCRYGKRICRIYRFTIRNSKPEITWRSKEKVK